MKLFFKSLLLLFFFLSNANANSIIRDAEIESVIREIADPIFKVAGLSPESIDIYIVNDPQINAYVTGGNRMFINTGLLGFSHDPNIITGVIAHETGHIAGGHILRSTEEYKSTALKATLGYMVGLAAAAAGSPQAGVAIASGAGHVAQRQMLKHSRTHEEAADQAALSYLEKTNQPAIGLLQLLEELYSKETAMYDNLNPYTLTHPLSRERISNVNNYIRNNASAVIKSNPELTSKFSRAITKLNAFLEPHSKTLKQYSKQDKTINAHYARAIAYYKIPDIERSIAEINDLLAVQSENPFFNELKGQVLFENGRVMESIPYYERAVELLPNSALLKIILATAQISSEKGELLKDAINNLERAILKERNNTFAWHQLAIAYGRSGDFAMSNLALAEESLIVGHKKQAKKFIELAKEKITPGSPAELRMKDMLTSIENDL